MSINNRCPDTRFRLHLPRKKKIIVETRRNFFLRTTITKKIHKEAGAKNIAKKLPVSLNQEIYQGVTVMLSAAEWLVPEVAVTVMLEVPGGVPFCGFVCGLPPPPQLTTSSASAMTLKTAEQRLAFLLRAPTPTTENPNTIPSDHATKVQGRRLATGTVAA